MPHRGMDRGPIRPFQATEQKRDLLDGLVMAAPNGLEEDAHRVIAFNHRDRIGRFDHGYPLPGVAPDRYGDSAARRRRHSLRNERLARWRLRFVRRRHIDDCQPWRLLNTGIFQGLAEFDVRQGADKLVRYSERDAHRSCAWPTPC